MEEHLPVRTCPKPQPHLALLDHSGNHLPELFSMAVEPQPLTVLVQQLTDQLVHLTVLVQLAMLRQLQQLPP